MSWNDVDNDGKGQSGGRFLNLKDGVNQRLRVLDSDPYTTAVHKISQVVNVAGKAEERFRTIPATANVDDSFILRHNPKRYAEQQQFNLRVWAYAKDDKGRDLDIGEITILSGGPQIFKQLKQLLDQNGDINSYDIFIKREGEKRDSKYFVTAAPVSKQIDVAALQAQIAANKELQWDTVFIPTTGADQERIMKEAGFDPAYDPAAELQSTMKLDDALETRFTFGKYGQKGNEKSLRDLVLTDAGYIQWAAENVTSNDKLAAACRVVVANMDKIGQPTKREVLGAPMQSTPAPAPASPAAPKPAASPQRAQLEARVSTILENDDRFADTNAMLATLKEHGNNKTRLKDFTVDQLQSLLEAIEV